MSSFLIKLALVSKAVPLHALEALAGRACIAVGEWPALLAFMRIRQWGFFEPDQFSPETCRAFLYLVIHFKVSLVMFSSGSDENDV